MQLKLTLKKQNRRKYLNEEQSIFILRIMRGFNAKILAVYHVSRFYKTNETLLAYFCLCPPSLTPYILIYLLHPVS